MAINSKPLASLLRSIPFARNEGRSVSHATEPTARFVEDELAREELRGLTTIFWCRSAVLAILSIWAMTLPFERSGGYLLALLVFGLLGALPRLLVKRGPRQKVILALFVLLDVSVLTFLLIVPPPFYVEDWTPQINLRLPNFLYVGIYIVGMALSYSPWLVLLSGSMAGVAWSIGFAWVATLPTSVLSSSRKTLDTGMSSEAVITSFLDRNTVSLTIWYNQLVFIFLVTVILTVTVWRSRQLVRRQVSAERERSNLARYFSPNIVEALTSGHAGLEQSNTQHAAILFADMVGFTSISENSSPSEIMLLLRAFHGRLAKVTFNHGGTVDKYIGDSIMVHFGTPEPREDDPIRALACAEAMIREIEQWNRERKLNDLPSIGIGIGLHYGEVVVGNTGHARRLEYTVLGDTVNVASRLERLTRRTSSPVMVSDDLVSAARSRGSDPTLIMPGLHPDDSHRVRGRKTPIAVWCRAANP
ncbi:adenylate/guanylate cyclase domain-containing protein [Rhizobium vallis]|uniref:Adenylate/guanylate cyclase domain-containing protein n=1 Tax=Rhizobium vallis TaxID=634290 RepID=A0A3S0T4Z6_9HYPH|nr:adenylate/guanylate cyclase domain-containing protein [Rhizobium vallis]RUM24452.1 adenylate/guanylate cyclase domain-containing protein [Rhizobium vallis]